MPIDFAIDENRDLVLAPDGLAVEDASLHHLQEILATAPGQIGQFPTAGVDLESYIESEGTDGIYNVVRSQLEADGATLKTFKTLQEGLVVDAKY